MLKFFKGKDKGNLIYAPCKGRVVPLAEVPDPVFADKVLGDGFAVIPADGRIYAPADGEVAMVFDTLHAVTLTSTQGAEISDWIQSHLRANLLKRTLQQVTRLKRVIF